MAFDAHVDAREVEAFLRTAPREQERAVQSFLQRGAHFLRGQMVRDAARRFGVETNESRMATVDPMRPKGIWAGSLSAQVRQGQALVGPNTPYDWWIERGAEAPRGVPAKLASARFRGHRVVERSVTDGRERLQGMWDREVRSAIWRSL